MGGAHSYAFDRKAASIHVVNGKNDCDRKNFTDTVYAKNIDKAFHKGNNAWETKAFKNIEILYKSATFRCFFLCFMVYYE